MDMLKKVKQNKKSEVYENEKYIVKIKVGGLAFPPKRYADGDGPQYFDILELRNKETGKSASTRVFQGDPISDLNSDLASKSQFGTLFKRID